MQEVWMAVRQMQPPGVFCKKKLLLKNFEKFKGKHLCQIFFLIKLQDSGNFIKKETLA